MGEWVGVSQARAKKGERRWPGWVTCRLQRASLDRWVASPGPEAVGRASLGREAVGLARVSSLGEGGAARRWGRGFAVLVRHGDCIWSRLAASGDCMLRAAAQLRRRSTLVVNFMPPRCFRCAYPREGASKRDKRDREGGRGK